MIEHKSSGGFVFFNDLLQNKIYVALLTNKAGQVWIPKGHIENGESEQDAAFREIKEEIGLEPKTLKYLGRVSRDEYCWEDSGVQHHKELFIHAFSSSQKQKFISAISEDIVSVNWYQIEDAMRKITFNKKDLINAANLFYLFEF